MFIIIKGENERYILYSRASSTLEVIAAVDGKEQIISSLVQFCHRFNSRSEMERYLKHYKSSNTQAGITYSVYDAQVKEMWNNVYSSIWEEKINEIISSCFPKLKFFPRRKFKVKTDI